MTSSPDDYSKIHPLLQHNDPKNVLLGIELLKSTRDADLISRFLSSPSYISSLISFPLVSFFQKNPDIWKLVQECIPEHRQRDIQKWMKHKILVFKNPHPAKFCQLAQREVQKISPHFPPLRLDILTRQWSNYDSFEQEGESLKEGLGWKLFIASRDIGPAEIIHEEEWTAIALHPEFQIHVKHFQSGGMLSQTWLERISEKPEPKN